MKVLLVGAGAQGGPGASVLARDNDVSEIVLGDVNLEVAKKVAAKVGSDKITPMKLDAGKVNEVAQAAKGADAVINLTLTQYDKYIMEGALESGAHYVDTSFGEPELLDIRARDNILAEIIEKRPLFLNKEFKNAGLSAVLGCGNVPGIVNLIARYLCDKLDEVDTIRILVGDHELNPSKEIASGWRPGWSPARDLWGFAVEPTIFEDGQYKRYPIFSSPEEYTFPAPVGKKLLTYHQHPEPITLPHFIGKGIKKCEMKHPIDILAGAFVRMGFANPDPIDVKGVKVVPRDVLLKLVPPPGNAFLAEDEASCKLPPNEVMCSLVEVYGTQSGEKVQYTAWHFHGPDGLLTPEERANAYRKLGTNRADVAFPAVVGAKLCVKGAADKGVICAECLNPGAFFGTMADMGVPIRLHENVSRQTSFGSHI